MFWCWFYLFPPLNPYAAEGASFGWLRFFVYPLLIAVAWLPFELHEMKIGLVLNQLR